MRMSDIIQQPTDLMSAIAVAMSDALGSPPELLKCYRLFNEWCAAGIAEEDADGQAEAHGVMTVLRFSEIEGLQKHLSRVFVQPGSEWMSSEEDVTLGALEELLCVLQQYEVPVTQGFVAACKQICYQHAPARSSTAM